MISWSYCKLWQTDCMKGYKRLFESRIYLTEVSSVLWLPPSSKIGLPWSSVLNISSGFSMNCGEMLFKSFKKEVCSAE